MRLCGVVVPCRLSAFFSLPPRFEWSGALAANTLDPRTSFPRALSLSVLIMTSVYLLPLLVSFGVYPAYSTVTEGFYPVIARSLGAGEWLPLTLVLGAATSSLGTYCSYLFASSSVIRGVTGWNQRACIVLLSTAALLLTPFDFAALVELEAFMYSTHVLIVVASFLQLRRRKRFGVPRQTKLKRARQRLAATVQSAGRLARRYSVRCLAERCRHNTDCLVRILFFCTFFTCPPARNEFVIIAVGVASLITIMMVVAVVAVVRRRRRTI